LIVGLSIRMHQETWHGGIECIFLKSFIIIHGFYDSAQSFVIYCDIFCIAPRHRKDKREFLVFPATVEFFRKRAVEEKDYIIIP
jgi:hypothetical protein